MSCSSTVRKWRFWTQWLGQMQLFCRVCATSPSHHCGTLTIFKWDSAAFQNDQSQTSEQARRQQPGWHSGVASGLPEACQLRAARLATSLPHWLRGSWRCWGKPAAALAEWKPALGPGGAARLLPGWSESPVPAADSRPSGNYSTCPLKGSPAKPARPALCYLDAVIRAPASDAALHHPQGVFEGLSALCVCVWSTDVPGQTFSLCFK